VLARELKRARAAAATGQVRDLRRALDSATAVVEDVAAKLRAAKDAYDVDEAELLASGAYAKELIAAASEVGVAIFDEDDRLLCYPSIVRVQPAELALEIDRRKARGLRPSVVVEQLRRAQQAGPRFKPEPFLASLLAAYDLVAARHGRARSAVVRLLDVYGVLTLLPGQAREYTKPEFARDLYLLDQSGVTTVGSPERKLRWAGSTGTRQSGVLTTVAKSGQQQRYWGIAFEEAGP
jgi:DNA-binding FrmR family transcriptional regulator